MHAFVESGAAGKTLALRYLRDLLEEGPGLVRESVVLAETDARGVHRQTAGDVRVFRAENDLPIAVLRRLAPTEEQLNLGWAALIEGGGAIFAEHLEGQTVRVSGGDPGHLQGADPGGESGRERGVVIVGDRLEDI